MDKNNQTDISFMLPDLPQPFLATVWPYLPAKYGIALRTIFQISLYTFQVDHEQFFSTWHLLSNPPHSHGRPPWLPLIFQNNTGNGSRMCYYETNPEKTILLKKRSTFHAIVRHHTGRWENADHENQNNEWFKNKVNFWREKYFI